jgi:NAD+ kinase
MLSEAKQPELETRYRTFIINSINQKVQPNMKRVLIVYHPLNNQASDVSESVEQYLLDQGLQVIRGKMDEDRIRSAVRAGNQDFLIALGGDGTMLRAGHLAAPYQLPILGINLGRFGFLTEIQRNEWEEALERVLDGDYWKEKRMMIRAEHYRNDQLLGKWDALNDAVISRGKLIRPIQLEIAINGRHLSTYVADAVIASTATGSTAYAMAAGGPILSPELRNMVLVSVAPHLSIEQSLVLSEDVQVSITSYTEHYAVISIDGQEPVDLLNGDRIEMTASDHTVNFIRFQDPGYFYRNLIPYMDQNPIIKKKNVRR